MQRDTVEEEKISQSIDESHQSAVSVSISLDIHQNKKKPQPFWHFLFCFSFWQWCSDSKKEEEEQKIIQIREYIQNLKLQCKQYAKKITTLLLKQQNVKQISHSTQLVQQNENIEQKKKTCENSITSQIINISIQSHVNVPNPLRQQAIQTKLINFSYQLNNARQNLENDQVNTPSINQNQNQQFKQIQDNPQQFAQPKRNIKILSTMNVQDNLPQQHIEQPFQVQQIQHIQEEIPQQQFQQQEQIDFQNESEQFDNSQQDSFDCLNTLPINSHCQRCQNQILGSKLQTSCFHDYHQECFDEMIETQVFNEIATEIQCQCQRKLNVLILTQVNYEKQQQIKEQLYKNQIQQIKKKLNEQGRIQHCRTQNCAFFYIGQQDQGSFCEYCQK